MSNIAIRHYEPADYDMLCAWWHGHGQTELSSALLPKCGVICELDGKPVSALFLHMDNSNGTCLIDHAISLPGLPLKKSLSAFKHCVACLKQIAHDLGYHTMAVFTYPSIARVLDKCGFEKGMEGLVQMLTSTKEDK